MQGRRMAVVLLPAGARAAFCAHHLLPVGAGACHCLPLATHQFRQAPFGCPQRTRAHWWRLAEESVPFFGAY